MTDDGLAYKKSKLFYPVSRCYLEQKLVWYRFTWTSLQSHAWVPRLWSDPCPAKPGFIHCLQPASPALHCRC